MIAWLRARVHVTFGRRRWEVQAYRGGEMVNYSGEPFLTKGEATKAAAAWRGAAFDEVVARNVGTGETAR